MKNFQILRRNLSQLIMVNVLVMGAVSYPSHASFDRAAVPGRLSTQLTASEIAREALDEKAFPHFMKFLKTVDVSKGIHPTDPRNAQWIKSTHYFTPTPEMWGSFLKAAVADKLTCLRAFSLLAREVKKSGVVMFGPGKLFEDAVVREKIDMGLAIPAHDMGGAIWSPDPNNQDPEFQAHIKVFYSASYIHQFPDEVLPANLKIGYREPEIYWMEGKEYKQAAVDADIYYGPNGVGFRHVKGVGGQKRGVMGMFQKVLFFLPDAIEAMTINEQKGAMVTEALINTTVKDFEKKPIYAMKVRSN